MTLGGGGRGCSSQHLRSYRFLGRIPGGGGTMKRCEIHDFEISSGKKILTRISFWEFVRMTTRSGKVYCR